MIDSIAAQEFNAHEDVDAALSSQLDSWVNGFGTGLSGMQTTILDNGNCKLHGFDLSLHFNELTGYWITLGFGGSSSAEFVPTLRSYSVNYHG